jgi:thioredoxin-like negative regulator of GroEL
VLFTLQHALAAPLAQETLVFDDDSVCDIQSHPFGSDLEQETPCSESPFKRVTEVTPDDLTRIGGDEAPQNIVIDIDAWWCDHSKLFAPRFEEMADRLVMRSDVKLIHVDAAKSEALRKALGVTGYPTVILWKKGSTLWDGFMKFTGKRNRANLLSWIEYNAPSSHAELGAPKFAADDSANSQVLFCDAAATLAGSAQDDLVCNHKDDPLAESLLVQRSKKVWNAATGAVMPVFPPDNSLPKTVDRGVGEPVVMTDSSYHDLVDDGKYHAILFYSSKCQFSACLPSVWAGVAYHLVMQGRQGDLVVGLVDGDANPALRGGFGVTKYPTFLLANKEKTRVLAQYRGSKRRVFDLSVWIQDLIVADENNVVKHVFDERDLAPAPDYDVVWPFTVPSPSPSESVSPSISPTISVTPSPSPICFPDDELLMEVFFESTCEDFSDVCFVDDEAVDMIRSICPEECNSCETAVHDNHVAFSMIFQSVCEESNMTDCSCDRLPEVDICVPSLTDLDYLLVSRVMYTICPETCDAWGLAYLNRDKTFKQHPALNDAALVQHQASVQKLTHEFLAHRSSLLQFSHKHAEKSKV